MAPDPYPPVSSGTLLKLLWGHTRRIYHAKIEIKKLWQIDVAFEIVGRYKIAL